MTPTAMEIAEAWVRKWSLPDPAIGVEDFDLDWDIPRDHPDLCLEAIFKALILIPPDEPRFIGLLAAGPLEDLLDMHGADLIDRVEARASSDPAFAFLLGGVWQAEISEDIWQRVQSVWDRRGWDGNDL